MNRYRIIGATRKTGADIQIDVDARSESDAERVAFDRGVVVSELVLTQTPEDRTRRAGEYGKGALRVVWKWNKIWLMCVWVFLLAWFFFALAVTVVRG